MFSGFAVFDDFCGSSVLLFLCSTVLRFLPFYGLPVLRFCDFRRLLRFLGSTVPQFLGSAFSPSITRPSFYPDNPGSDNCSTGAETQPGKVA